MKRGCGRPCQPITGAGDCRPLHGQRLSFSAKKLDLVIKYVRSLARKLGLSKRRQEVVEMEGVRCLKVVNARTMVIRRVKTKTSGWELSSSTYKPDELG